jgi:hypothetical protein
MDRFLRGFIIGVLTSAVKDAINLFSNFMLHFSRATYADYMSIILIGKPAKTTALFIISQILELGFEGLIGIVFIYFAYRTKNKKTLWFN